MRCFGLLNALTVTGKQRGTGESFQLANLEVDSVVLKVLVFFWFSFLLFSPNVYFIFFKCLIYPLNCKLWVLLSCGQAAFETKSKAETIKGELCVEFCQCPCSFYCSDRIYINCPCLKRLSLT